ncbi:MAG: benzoate-CoA ligase family protein, partial [Xanthobacteraceae bacterium]|nr:benzoate-CoA ligase family protein [Xanthobacteraceae bacterium]
MASAASALAVSNPVQGAPATSTEIPRDYNFAADILDRNLAAGRANKPVFIDQRGSWTYGELADRANRFGAVLRAKGVRREERILICLLDTIDWPTAFLGALKAGVVAVPVNTLMTEADYAFMLADSRARMLVVSDVLLPRFEKLITSSPDLAHVVVSGADPKGHERLEDLLAAAPAEDVTAPTTRDDIAFWLYTSGSTGKPKGAVHVHASLRLTNDLYAAPILGLNENDVCYSVAKLFFAYGLGNALTFPMSVGATTILLADRPTPEAVAALLRQHPVSVFYGVPTFYAGFLASAAAPELGAVKFRRCVSAGEALPSDVGRRWRERYGCDILDGIGSTEMLHIFLSNSPGDVKYGTTGKPVPGYEVRLVDEAGMPVKPGEMGELIIRGPSSAIMYWNNREQSRTTFRGEWTKSGDKYVRDADGVYTYCGRADDMLKVSGMYVSPFEVEGALLSHNEVLEAAVVAWLDEEGLVKPKAFVVLKAQDKANDALA